jgi:hypothetical protein
VIIEAPQPILDRIVDRLIEESGRSDGFRWVFELDACRIDWRRRDGLCPCGFEVTP